MLLINIVLFFINTNTKAFLVSPKFWSVIKFSNTPGELHCHSNFSRFRSQNVPDYENLSLLKLPKKKCTRYHAHKLPQNHKATRFPEKPDWYCKIMFCFPFSHLPRTLNIPAGDEACILQLLQLGSLAFSRLDFRPEVNEICIEFIAARDFNIY